MPLAPTPCLEPNCPDYATYMGRCPDHQRDGWANKAEPRKNRLPPDWNTRRAIVFKRDDGVCHVCHQPGADECDHINVGDDHSLENLAPIHQNVPPYCHRYKTSAEGHQARAGMATKPRF